MKRSESLCVRDYIRVLDLCRRETKTIEAACDEVGISESTFYRWQRDYRDACGFHGLSARHGVVLDALSLGEAELDECYRRLDEQAEKFNELEQKVKEQRWKLWLLEKVVDALTPAEKRELIDRVVNAGSASERAMCEVLGQSRSTQRYEPVDKPSDEAVSDEVARLSEENPRAGYKQITDLMKESGWDVGYERVRLIRKELELQARPGRKNRE